MTEKRPVGRPRTTVDDLPDNWQDLMRNCGQEGGSAVEARCLLGISTTAWSTLLEDSDEFRKTEKERKALCEVWWERQGRRMATGDPGNATVWIFNMKNRFGWRDQPKDEDEDKVAEPMNITFNVQEPVKSIKVTQGKKRKKA